MQLIIGSLMLYISANAERLFEHVGLPAVVLCIYLISEPYQPVDNVHELTFVFTSLVFFSATQGN
jgi:PAT family acetyl-CoA transporter-like MFS transporter 1